MTGFEALGQYQYRNPIAGYAALSTIVRSGFTWGLGRNPEVWSGSQFEPLDTAVPHQFFGTSFILTVLARGLLGWEPDVPRGIVRLAPQLPTDSARNDGSWRQSGAGSIRLPYHQWYQRVSTYRPPHGRTRYTPAFTPSSLGGDGYFGHGKWSSSGLPNPFNSQETFSPNASSL